VGEESGLVLDLADAMEVSGRAGAPPPPPSQSPQASASPLAAPATEVMLNPASFSWAEPWYRRRGPRIGGAVALLIVLALSANALMRGGRHADKATANAPEAAPPAAPAAQPAPPPAPAPTPVAAPAPPAPAPAAAKATAPAADAASAPTAAGAAPALAAAAEPPAVEPPAAPRAAEAPRSDDADTASESAQAHSVSVMLKSDPEGSKVSTRHRSYGTTPVAIKLRPGSTHELTFSKPGYLPQSKRYRVTDKDTQLVRVSLKKVPEPAAARRASAAKPKPASKPAAPSQSQKKSPPAAEARPAPPKKKDFFSR
jgi:hypothetical protein